uniref:Uncharacterized protein n=1 Tax=Setaria italica TaxID=4555 RepID=K3XUD8_SETIT
MRLHFIMPWFMACKILGDQGGRSPTACSLLHL